MNAEALLKGRVAHALVELLLEANGYGVRNIGKDGVLGGILREDTLVLNQSDSAGKIRTAPSLAVFDKKKEAVVLVRVKYRAESQKGRNISHGVKQLLEYWPEAILVVVTSEPPMFRVIQSPGKEEAIESVFRGVRKDSLKEFERLVGKFLKN